VFLERRCSFCGKPEKEVGRLFAGERSPTAFICNECVDLCGAALAAEGATRSDAPPRATMVPWKSFELEGETFEWSATRVTVPKRGESIMVTVRRPGDASGGEAALYPPETKPSVEHAEETVKKFRDFL
jgi:hypothetical protein